MTKVILGILLNALPAILMVALIPFVRDDVLLSLIYIVIIAASLFVKRERYDYVYLIFGFFTLLLSEYFFIKTGIEVFLRQSLLSVMPLWLPILWAYVFAAIKRSIVLMDASL